ncbi:hypothetical protein E2C01_102269 [Portunus trituberculatus]|uniref:Uncharacterized protein n=1 Tax=Portunus trituberculatus TaxID=210409 RepID=A0A5B7KNT9_PORTR|nr:hypothetical protein [Portunus trituberculatus]
MQQHNARLILLEHDADWCSSFVTSLFPHKCFSFIHSCVTCVPDLMVLALSPPSGGSSHFKVLNRNHEAK